MRKVYPKASDSTDEEAMVLTVWNKSLLPNCNGFTVFDCQGNLVFRVDNYIAANKDEILLMDAAGTPLLTIRRKRVMGLGDSWVVFEGEGSNLKPLFTAKKNGVNNILKSSKCLAQLLRNKEVTYEIEGSYLERCCKVYDNKKRKVVAEMKKKEAVVGRVAFGVDVFRLFVHSDMDATLAMAIVILLHHMFLN